MLLSMLIIKVNYRCSVINTQYYLRIRTSTSSLDPMTRASGVHVTGLSNSNKQYWVVGIESEDGVAVAPLAYTITKYLECIIIIYICSWIAVIKFFLMRVV